ncbi:solute carrier family 22 member 7-like [Varroa jacobsoni]|uniref:Major facilitator superfamily (MFS) profile domain-containing protein n=1 Tax=Varroa destructor TaxID=109461 RepID=A0A7M7MI18_VARDE|nr:solute carrier family 22 member 7-like [Varroa destructor]XP_022687229.1 solute carrier family 22 member 7-like [Varroa jacobsoni]
MVDVNALVDKIGPWQIPVFLLIILRSWPLEFHILFLSFAAPSKQDHWCARPAQFVEKFSVDEWKRQAIPVVQNKFSRCLVRKWVEENGKVRFLNETENCKIWEYDTTYYDWTVVREFGLVCDKSWYVSASQASFMAGIMVGNVVFAKIADRYGRRKSLLWSTLLMIVVGFITVFCRDYWSFNVARFGISIACGAYQCTILSLLMECLSAKKRSWAMLSSFGWTTGSMILPWTAYLLPNWIYQQILYAASAIPCLIIWKFLPESPRWLLASGHVDKAETAIGKLVRKNNLKNVDVGKMFEEYRENNNILQGTKPRDSVVGQPAYADLFRGPRMRVRSVCILIMYFANRLLMFHLTFFSSRMGGNPFWGFTLVALLTIPSDIISVICIRHVKRRPTMFISFLGTGAFILLLVPFGEDQFMARVILCTLAKSLNGIGACSLGVFASESFPTVIRAMGIGSAYTSSRFGAMFSPFFKELADFAGPAAAAAVSAGIAALGALSTLFLPETLNKELPDSLADVDPEVYASVETRAKDTHEADDIKNGVKVQCSIRRT